MHFPRTRQGLFDKLVFGFIVVKNGVNALALVSRKRECGEPRGSPHSLFFSLLSSSVKMELFADEFQQLHQTFVVCPTEIGRVDDGLQHAVLLLVKFHPQVAVVSPDDFPI